MQPHLPIDRTKISKALISDPSKIALRSADFYKKLQVEFVLDTEATKLDLKNSKVELSNGSTESYENLILATGANPIRLPLDGADLDNVFLLRGVKDAEGITSALGGEPEKEEDKKNVVIIGSSFIGMEAAVAAAGKANVTVVGMENAPFEKILGKEIGNGIKKVSFLLYNHSFDTV
jgi:NAD(P)H-nitrite reductase large subunit